MAKLLLPLVLATSLLQAGGVAQESSDPVLSAESSGLLRLRYASFDPMVDVPAIAEPLRSQDGERMWIVQYSGVPTTRDREAIAGAAGQVIGYLPDNAYVVRMHEAEARALRDHSAVRWLGRYHAAYRLDPALIADQAWLQPKVVRYNIVVADKLRDKAGLIAKVKACGGIVNDEQLGGLLISVSLTGGQLLQVVRQDEVLWMDRHTAPELDVDNARIQGGGNYVEAIAGYTGATVNAHIYEGIEASHPDFTGGATAVRSSVVASQHGHATAGIVFGNGASNAAVRGMAPDAGKFYTAFGTGVGSRWQVVSDLVNIHDVSHTTASWGSNTTVSYTSASADADDIVFDHDIAWTQSQSNSGTQMSRPEAWAKNVFSIGGVVHGNNSSAADDSWSGGASTGPASDGRIKPTLCAYYDQIGTSDLTGLAGYATGDWFAGFNGTSGATPIVAGHNLLAIEMFADEVQPGFGTFGNALRTPGGTTHQNRPHVPTLKALQVVSAAQYTFDAASTDNRREHQGWGFPSLRRMFDMRDKTFLVDETDVLRQGNTRNWTIAVPAGEPEFKVCLNWIEPAANPTASVHLVNNLSLRVTSPTGVVYWGNHGLQDGVWSQPGGSEDSINSLECVFVENPAAGNWSVEVMATAVVADNHKETLAVDADYGLAVHGGVGPSGPFASFEVFGQGCLGSATLPNPPCTAHNPNGGPLSQLVAPFEYAYLVGNVGTRPVTRFEIWTQSTGGTVTIPVHLYQGMPAPTLIASTTMTVGPTPGFYPAILATPATLTGGAYVGVDSSAQTVQVSDLLGVPSTLAWRRAATGSTWSFQLISPGIKVFCEPIRTAPVLTYDGPPSLGSTYSVALSDALPATFAISLFGTSASMWSGGSLPFALPGAPGCDLLVAPDVLVAQLTSATGTATAPLTVPNTGGLVGFRVFHQFAVLDNVNALGVALSNGGRATVGN